jgi:hypothetical protein
MQSLNLSGESKKSDGWLKSLLWPTVDNPWDVDYLGQQGFWICLILAIFSFLLLAFSASEVPNPAGRITVFILAGVLFFVYVVGGMGVRESSWAAAAMIFTIYALNELDSGRPPGILSIIVGGVLLSNVRATFLASRWKPIAEGEDRPTRFSETFRDKLVDQLPPRVWPVLRVPFFITSTLLLIFLSYAAAMLLAHPHSGPPADENATPSATVTAEPAGNK